MGGKHIIHFLASLFRRNKLYENFNFNHMKMIYIVGYIRYIKFDTFTPAAERGLPVTRVISRMTLQQILAEAVGEDIIMNGSNVVDFEDNGNKVI